MKRIAFISVLIGLYFLAHTQSYYFKHYQVENGLSNNTVFCAVQDKKGFIWLGTKDGLNRFDGTTFKIFSNQQLNAYSLGDNFIRSLFLDQADDVYIGTRKGIYKFLPLTEQFELVYDTDMEVRDIKKDVAGNLWFISGQTLIRFNEKNRQVFIYNTAKYFFATSVCIDVQQQVWVSTANGLLQLYQPATNTFCAYPVFSNQPALTDKWIEKIVATPYESILIGTSRQGAKQFDLKTKQVKHLLLSNSDNTEIFARDFAQINDHEIWIATESGLFLYNTFKGSFLNFKKQYNHPYAIADNAVYCLLRDREGGIWAGSYFGGVNYYPKQYTPFEKYFPAVHENAISGNAVREICEDQYGNIWIGTEDAGLNKLNPQTNAFTPYKPTGKISDISYPNIHGLLAKGNELWVGTFEHGLNIMDIPTGKVIRHFPKDKNTQAFRSNFIVTILQTSANAIYMGTRQGLYLFDAASYTFQLINDVAENALIHCLWKDADNMLWIGTMGNGLYAYDLDTKSVRHFFTNGDKGDLPNNNVTTIFEDKAHTLWIGTEGGGLTHLDKSTNSFIAYHASAPLPGNTVYKILEDNNSNLWITTSKGLVSYNLTTKQQNVYTTANGLLSDQFNYNSGYKDHTGRMYFGSLKGLITFNPDSFITNIFIPPVYFTSLQINNEDVAIGEKEPLQQSPVFTNTITLRHDQSSFSVAFAALSFTAPETISYKYIMDGVDKEWVFLKANRKLYFTSLSPGTYTLRVKAANSSGIWNSEEKILTIIIQPPFWASRWAYATYVLLALVLVYAVLKFYYKRIAERNTQRIEKLEREKEKEIYQTKIDFFTNIAHEIKTPLTLIKAPLERMMEKAADVQGIQRYLQTMHNNTNRLVELTQQLLDFRKIETDKLQLKITVADINALLHQQYQNFIPIAEGRGLRFKVIFPSTIILAAVDLDAFQKIVNNIFQNALNYADNNIEARLYSEDHYFVIECRNDGAQIPGDSREKIFEPFFRLEDSKNKSGTGIGLSLARSLAHLHQGALFVQEDRVLNIFILKMPLDQQNQEN